MSAVSSPMAPPAPPPGVPPPSQTMSNAPLQRTRSEYSLPIDRPHHLTKQHSIDSDPVAASRPSRRLSMPYNKPMRGKYALPAAQSTHRRHEEALKTARFERMMDRFQLRRVALSRSSSNNSTATLTSQRDTAQVTPYSTASNTPQDPTRFLSTREHDVIEEHPTPVGASPDGFPRATMTAMLRGQLTREPLHPTGCLSQLRLVVVAVLFVTQLASFPFVLAYARTDSELVSQWTRVDLATDLAFLLSIAMLCNTATSTGRGQPITTRRAILRQYRRRGLLLDVLAALPLELLCAPATWGYGMSTLLQLMLRGLTVRRHWRHFQIAWVDATADQESQQTWLDWVLYSRFGHLLRIGRLVLFVVLISHYLACAWTFLRVSNHTSTDTRSALAIHLHSIYDVLQLLQGQGVETTTVAQDVFGSMAVLLGSIALAVVFGHVAVLVANFMANRTAYQRKMENVFAVMDKLQLPGPIRERVHQYYEYLHAEYESLDGEIVKFVKDLSHTLELEVVLFKYMDVVMHVPHWRECSADFQKQLVLNLTVRVYLPDDFVIRRGEVGTSCFIISRGVCKQYEYPGGNDEAPTPPLPEEDLVQSSATRTGLTRPSDQRYTSRGVLQSNGSTRSAGEGHIHHAITLVRGQAVGEKALITNYARSSDVRAFTNVEMCVLERETFQRILTRYPQDRESVLTNVIRQSMEQRAIEGLECQLMAMVHRVVPHAMIDQAVAFVVEAMSPKLSDPSLIFGATEHLEEALQRVAVNRNASHSKTSGGCCGTEARGNSALEEQVDQLQTQLDRIEQMLQSVVDHRSAEKLLPTMLVVSAQERAHQLGELTKLTTTTASAKVAPQRSMSYRAVRLSRRASETVVHSPVSSSTHTQYADRLFQAQRTGAPAGSTTRPRNPLHQ